MMSVRGIHDYEIDTGFAQGAHTVQRIRGRAHSSADKGGDIGWIPAFSLPAPFANAIRAQGGKPGLIDHPLRVENGWHVLEVLESRPSHPPALADVSERFSARLRWDAVVPPAVWADAQRRE